MRVVLKHLQMISCLYSAIHVKCMLLCNASICLSCIQTFRSNIIFKFCHTRKHWKCYHAVQVFVPVVFKHLETTSFLYSAIHVNTGKCYHAVRVFVRVIFKHLEMTSYLYSTVFDIIRCKYLCELKFFKLY